MRCMQKCGYGQEKQVKWKSHDGVAVCLSIKRELISESHMLAEETFQKETVAPAAHSTIPALKELCQGICYKITT